MTDNELIAEFMGVNHKPDPFVKSKKLYWHYNQIHLMSESLLFDQSWDWLMPVVEKIESLGHEVDVYKNACEIDMEEGMIREVAGSKIEATYISIVKFIKWYNSNHPQP